MSAPERRWLDSEIPADLRDALASADLDRAPDAQLASLSARLERAIGPEWAAASATNTQPALSSPAAVSGGVGWGGALAIATALLAGLGAVWYGTRPHAPPREVQHAAVTASLPLQPAGPALEPTPAVQPAPQPTAAPPVKHNAPPAAQSGGLRPAAQSGGLIEELKQLEAIRRLLPAEPKRALRDIAQHARRFPQGALGPERELLRIEALLRAGRGDEAQRAAERALRSGSHPYAAQIRQLLAGQL